MPINFAGVGMEGNGGGMVAGEGLNGDHAHGIEVAAEVGPPGDLFAGHVALGADGNGVANPGAGGGELGADLLDGAEVDHHNAVILLSSDQVGGFQVAVDDVMAMDTGQGPEQITETCHHLGLGPGGTGEFGFQGMALDQLLGQIEVTLLFEVGQQAGDGGMVAEAVEGVGFGLE